MAQPSQTLQFVCRSCRHSISSAKSSTQARTFSSSSAQFRTIPTFTPTSSSELDAILADWRARVFTPSALSEHHRRLVYKTSRQRILENDPGVTVTMSNDEEVKLEPMNRFDRPNKKVALQQIARLLGETKDAAAWENLPPFLEGMQLSKEKVPLEWLEKMTRKANEMGKAGVVKRCAEMQKRTGVTLGMRPVTRELMLGYHERAVEAGLKGPAMLSAATDAESLASLMLKPEHCAGALKSGQTDMRKDSVVLGVLLELAAAKAIDVHGGKDVDGVVGSYATKLLALVKDENVLQRGAKPTSGHAVEDWLPIANGILLATRVGGLVTSAPGGEVQIKKDLQAVYDKLHEAIKEEVGVVRKEANGKKRRALSMLEKVQALKL